jgi:hypothetical protein
MKLLLTCTVLAGVTLATSSEAGNTSSNSSSNSGHLRGSRLDQGGLSGHWLHSDFVVFSHGPAGWIDTGGPAKC